MDAFITRAPCSGPAPSSVPSKRLPPSSTIPSFYNAKRKQNNREHTGKNDSSSCGATARQSQVPVASTSQLKQTILDMTKSLKSADNPITHSTAYSSAFHYVSCSSGHQHSDGRSRESLNNYATTRSGKLKAQGEKPETTILAGIKVYINGVTTPIIGNLELIKLIQRNGGEVKYNFSKRGCTHIICLSGLSASKTHKEMSSRSNTKIVSPQWILDSVDEGKKLAESKYWTLESRTQASIKASLSEKSSSIKATPSIIPGTSLVLEAKVICSNKEEPMVISSTQ